MNLPYIALILKDGVKIAQLNQHEGEHGNRILETGFDIDELYVVGHRLQANTSFLGCQEDLEDEVTLQNYVCTFQFRFLKPVHCLQATISP